MNIKIQKDYWTGTECMANEVPWQTPGSIQYLDAVCRPTDTVLEIGTGGSTLFYARRCKSVVAIETNAQWFAAVNQQLKARGISNVTYLLINNQADIEAKLQNLPDFTIVSDDSVHGFNRSRFLNIILARYKAMRVLVLDNYGDQALFPDHYNKSITDMLALCPPAWVGADYDDARWCGKGTRILSAE